MGACADARQWAEQYDNWKDIVNNCKRSGWLLWLDGKLDILDDNERRLLACYMVRNTPLTDGRTVWDLLTDDRSRNAVVVAERYANGNATQEELAAARAAAGAAWDAAGAAAWAAAGAARDAAWDAQSKHIIKKYGKRIIASLNTKYPSK